MTRRSGWLTSRFEDKAAVSTPESATLAVVYYVDLQRVVAFSLKDGVVTGIDSTRLPA